MVTSPEACGNSSPATVNPKHEQPTKQRLRIWTAGRPERNKTNTTGWSGGSRRPDRCLAARPISGRAESNSIRSSRPQQSSWRHCPSLVVVRSCGHRQTKGRDCRGRVQYAWTAPYVQVSQPVTPPQRVAPSNRPVRANVGAGSSRRTGSLLFEPVAAYAMRPSASYGFVPVEEQIEGSLVAPLRTRASTMLARAYKRVPSRFLI